jgi:hypothetical protein
MAAWEVENTEIMLDTYSFLPLVSTQIDISSFLPSAGISFFQAEASKERRKDTTAYEEVEKVCSMTTVHACGNSEQA